MIQAYKKKYFTFCDQFQLITIVSILGIQQILIFAHALRLDLLYLQRNNNLIQIFNNTQITKMLFYAFVLKQSKTFVQLHT